MSAAEVCDQKAALFVRSAGGLALIGASLAAGTRQGGRTWLVPFLHTNTLPEGKRLDLMEWITVGVVIGVVVSVALMWRFRRRDPVSRLARIACLVAPLGLLGPLPALLAFDAWPDELTYVVVLALFVAIQEPVWRLHFTAYATPPGDGDNPGPIGNSRWRAMVARFDRLPELWRRRLPWVLIAAMAIAYASYMGFFTVRNHHRFNTFTWDLGMLDNEFFNNLRGRPMRATPMVREGDWSQLRGHAHFFVFFLLPFYAIYPAAETPLILQAVFVGAGGIALFALAARRITKPAALLLCAAYYLYPPLHGALFFDVHLQLFALPLVLATLACFDARRMRWFVVFFVLALSCREDIAIGMASFGLFLLLTGHRVRQGVAIFIVSALYFGVVKFVVMPAAGEWRHSDLFAGLYPEGRNTFAGVILTLLSNPLFTLKTMLTGEKLRYLLQILVPLAFLPLRRPYLLLAFIPGAFSTLLTTNYPAAIDIGFQYSAQFVAYLFPACVLAIEAFGRGPLGAVSRRSAIAALIVATALSTARWGAVPPRHAFRSSYGYVSFDRPTREHRKRRSEIKRMVALVPPEAILAATDRELPHVSNRLECWNLSAGFVGADYILFAEKDAAPAEREQASAAIRSGYQRVKTGKIFTLLKRPGAP